MSFDADAEDIELVITAVDEAIADGVGLVVAFCPVFAAKELNEGIAVFHAATVDEEAFAVFVPGADPEADEVLLHVASNREPEGKLEGELGVEFIVVIGELEGLA